MTDEPDNGTARARGMPRVTGRADFEAERAGLLAREKAHTREGDAIAAARRRLPMVELDAGLALTGPGGPLTLRDAFEAMDYSYVLMDLTVYGRQEPWEDSPPGWPQRCSNTRTDGGPARLAAGAGVARRAPHRPVAAARRRALRRPRHRRALSCCGRLLLGWLVTSGFGPAATTMSRRD